MTVKCTRCIDHFQRQKKELELIHDLKGKNEGMSHAFLKTQACNMIRELGQNCKDFPTSVETEVSVKGIGKVDVVGQIGEVTIAVECGKTNPKKILALEEHFDIVLHIPYCYTWGLVNIDMDELEHQLAVELLAKGLKNAKVNFEKYKWFCLEKGECSLPSGRDGFPEEAMQIAGLHINHVKKKK